MLEKIKKSVTAGARLSVEEGEFLLSSAPLDILSDLASREKARRWGERVTFILDTNPNYTNICDCHCRFCAFYRKPGDRDAFTLTKEEMVGRVESAVRAGATTVLMQGGCNPDLPVDYYFDLVKTLRKAFPEVYLHLFSPPEIIAIARSGKISVRDVLTRLKALGLKSLPGGGAEMLVEEIRRAVSPKKCSAPDWLGVMREAHQLGFKTTATMVYGLGETDRDEIEHLAAIRALQDETEGFTAFVPWSFKPGNTELLHESMATENTEITEKMERGGPGGKKVEKEQGKLRKGKGPAKGNLPGTFVPGLKYLRLLAVARLFLDNFDHIQASWFSEGKRTGQLGLLFGADDFGGTLFEENVLKKTGHEVRSGIEEVKILIRGAGMVPVKRDTLYQKLEVCPT